MDSVTDVLVRTQDIPETPFDAKLYYDGIEITLKFSILIENNELILIKNNHPEVENNNCFNTQYKLVGKSKAEIIKNKVDIDNPVENIKNIPSRKENNNDVFVSYRHNDKIYIVEPVYRFTYKLQPKNSSKKYSCVERNEYEKIPENLPQTKISGKIKKRNKSIYMHSTNLFKKIFGINELKLNLEFNNNVVSYDKYELENTEYKRELNTKYNVAHVDIEYNTFVINTTYNDEEIKFEFKLTKLGTLPDWIDERIDSSMILSIIDSDDKLIAQIEPVDKASMWTDTSHKYELVNIE